MTFGRRLFPIAAILFFPVLARADINGFGDFSAFTINQHDMSAAPSLSGGEIRLTTPATSEDRSLFYSTPLDIRHFTASFAYRAAPNTSGGGTGATFIVQNSPAGAGAVETTTPPFNNQNIGYFGIPNSVAISFELRSAVASGTGLYAGGIYDASGGSSNPVVLTSGHLIDATFNYNGTLLQESLLDTVTGASFNTSYFVNIPSDIGSQSGYVGFTAGTTSGFATQQYFSNFQFASSIPEPAALSLIGVALGCLGLRRYR